jgi:hypothetical protein
MEKQRMDPWGTLYHYTLLPPKERVWRWELRSAGADRVFGTSDDIAAEEESGGGAVLSGEKEDPRPSF